MPQARGEHYFLVKPGMKSWFGKGSAFYVPEAAIASVTDDAVLLTYATRQLAAPGWDPLPANLAGFRRA